MSNGASAVKLVNLMGTKYLANFLEYELSDLFKGMREGVVIDLAGAKFGPAAFNKVKEYSTKIVFINSEDPELDAILREIESFERSIVVPNMEPPTINSWEDLVQYVKNFPQDKEYYSWKTTTSRNSLFAMIATILSYPKLRFDISNSYLSIFILLEALDAPKRPSPIYLSKNNPSVIYSEIPDGMYYTVSAFFLCAPPIDVESPDNHMFACVIRNMKEMMEDPPYTSFVDAAKEHFNF